MNTFLSGAFALGQSHGIVDAEHARPCVSCKTMVAFPWADKLKIGPLCEPCCAADNGGHFFEGSALLGLTGYVPGIMCVHCGARKP